jgi:hypothetical protein
MAYAWNDEKEAEAKKLEDKIKDLRKKILEGGFKKSEGKKLAVECKKADLELRQLRSAKNSIDANTAQSQAFAAQFNKLVSLCTVYNDTDEPYFSDYDDFLEKQDDKVTIEAATKLAYLQQNLDPDFEKKFPENKFLIEHGFFNEKLQWINKDGKLTDEEGRLVNDEGRFVNENGEYIDRDGNRVDEDGNPVVESKPVLDD